MPGDMSHKMGGNTIIVTPEGEKIESSFFFSSKDVYTTDGWYSCPETGAEWYLLKAKTIFTLDRDDDKLGRIYYSTEFGFCTKEEAEHFIRLKAFW